MFRLRSKILLAFSLIILSGTVLMVTFISFSTRSGYETFARQNDIVQADNFRILLTEYYRMNKSWEGVESLLLLPMQRAGQMRGMMNRNNPNPRNMFPLILLADSRGGVVVDSSPDFRGRERQLRREDLERGLEITVDNRLAGYIFVGSMLVSGLSESEKKYLNRTMMIIVLVSLFILAVSFVFSLYFAGKLAKPVSALTSASGRIQEGDFTMRVPVEGRDELSRLSFSFNQMTESLEKNDLWRKQIIADSAHELRTPVSLIQGNLEMILDGVYNPDREHLQNIYDETLVLARLIGELQELSSAESGSMKLNTEELDLNILIENVLGIFRAGEVKDKIKLINSITASLPPVSGDYQKLKQVFANVLANAFRHTPEGGKIEICAEEHNSAITVSIHDSGPGIPEADLEKIFERFYRTDDSRNRHHGGSGLGLAISREIIKLHGGKIYAESKSDSGATIFISIPL